MTLGDAPTRLLAAVATDVWAFDLTGPVDERVLSADELDRAAGLRFARDQQRFRRRRAHVRRQLAEYIGRSASAVRFVHNGYGKPALADNPEIHFSTSVSEDVALLAVSRHEVGIDVEVVRLTTADGEVARRLFAAEEAAAIADGPAEDFFRCWTRKEAYVKALGVGLSFPLESFAVEVRDVRRPRLLRSALRPDDIGSCTIIDISARNAGIVAALVVRSSAQQVIMHSTIQRKELQHER